MKKRETISPDITPLIDIVFLLLIFFLVTSIFKQNELALLLELPKVEQGGDTKSIKKSIIIEVNENDIALNKAIITLDKLSEDLKSQKDKSIPVELRIDKNIKYDKVVKILEVLQENSFNNIALSTLKAQ